MFGALKRKRTAAGGFSLFKRFKTGGSGRGTIGSKVSALITAKRAGLFRTGGRLPQERFPRTGELKNIDTVFAPIALGAGATRNLLNGLQPGTSATSRLGRKIFMKSMQLRFHAEPVGTTVGVPTPIRVLIVFDTQTNALMPAVTDVVVSDNIYAHMNLQNGDRFKVILDKEFKLGTSAIGTDLIINWKKFRRLNLVTTFNSGNLADVTDIQTGSLIMLCWQLGLTTTAPTSVMNSRIRFTDN